MFTTTHIFASIAAVISLAALALPSAAVSAGSTSPSPVQRIIEQEKGRHHDLRIFGTWAGGIPASRNSLWVAQGPSPVDSIIRQEDSRRNDGRLFGGYAPGKAVPAVVPVIKVDSGGFDWGDAGIGSAAMLALVLLLAGGAALWQTSRRQGAHT
jgi:hypothetical protein